MTGLDGRGVRLGERAVAAAVEKIVRIAGNDVPDDVRVEQVGATMVLSGRNLRARSMDDARLRGFGPAGGTR